MQLLSLFLILLTPAAAFAAEPPAMGSALLQMSWALLVVVGLILAIYGLAKKRWFLGKIGGSAIKIIELRPLTPKSTLALVEVRGKEYLLGITAEKIHPIDAFPLDAVENKPDFASLMAEQQ